MILAEGCTTRALQASLVILVVAAGLDLALINAFGAAGAAWATVGAAVTSCIVFDVLNRRVTGIGTPLPSLRLVAACAGSAAILLAVTRAVQGPWCLLGVVVLPLMLYTAKVVTPQDARELRDLVHRGHAT
jgi:peptidoglycan biosynthesis protein MviN/MurJ (putative lipid II flippase)